jgi:hypothetical protein
MLLSFYEEESNEFRVTTLPSSYPAGCIQFGFLRLYFYSILIPIYVGEVTNA